MMLGNENKFAAALERYLAATLHARIDLGKFEDTRSLPSFLTHMYSYYEADIAGHQCLFVLVDKLTATPADIRKHIDLIRSKIGLMTVLVAPSVSASSRARLIGRAVPFVVPGNQLYIPELAVDLREHFRAPKPLPASDSLTPAAQAVLFYHLLRRDPSATTASAMARGLGYSAMSVGRAFAGLEAAGIARTEKRGRERHLIFEAKRRDLFERAKSRLRSPVRSRKYIGDDVSNLPLKVAGESALAEMTNLAPPRLNTFAVAATEWKVVQANFALEESSEYDAHVTVETWSYDPAGLSDERLVDPLSLYAAFHNDRDERVAMAAERLLQYVRW